MKRGRRFFRWLRGQPTKPVSNVLEEVDSLTSLRNRRLIEPDIGAALDTAVKTREPLTIALVDLDRFQSVNDEYGHALGDELLIQMAQLLLSATRGKGSAYRYGGDQFVLLLPNYTALEAYALAERVRRESERTPLSSREVQVTVSLGISSSGERSAEPEQLFHSADHALAEAKTLGGNCVRVFGQDVDSEGGSFSQVREPGPKKGPRFGPRNSTARPP